MKKYPFPKSDPKIHSYQADIYSFRWPDYSSWAIFTVCDATGEFGIQSDWGTFSHRWNTGALGPLTPTLTEFLPSCEPNYIMRKLLMVKQEDTQKIFDPEATQKHWDELIEEHKENGWISDKENYEARLREEMKEFFDLVDDYCLDIAIHDITNGLWEFLGQAPYECLRYQESTTVAICRDELIPRFLQYLKDHVVPARAAS